MVTHVGHGRAGVLRVRGRLPPRLLAVDARHKVVVRPVPGARQTEVSTMNPNRWERWKDDDEQGR
jgi:hypothetical protein